MNITYTHKDIQNWVKNLSLFLFMLTMSLSTYAQTPEYATYTGTNTAGTGNFTCSEMPGFSYSITGDVAPGDTNVPSTGQIVDNNGGGMEIIYGEADAEQNIEVEVAGYGAGNGDGVGDAITNTVTTTINFDAPTPPGTLAFMIADIEQDQVMVCALDSDGNSVPISVIDGWFQASFDADNSEAGPFPPEWDSSTGTLVGQTTRPGNLAPGPVKQTVYVADLPDNEAGAAWFEVDIAITQLQFKSQALGVAPDDPSQHFFIATKCQEPTCNDLLNDPKICDYILDNPNSAIAQDDCDGGGISNLVECQTGENPSDPSDDCMSLMDAGLDICTILAADPTNGLATQDCDNGGVDNLTECNDNKDPKDPTDDVPPNPCEAPIGCSPVPTLDVCSDGMTRTIGCDTGLENANVVWFNGMGVQVGTGCDLVIDNTMIQNGNVGDMMCFYYVAEDPANPGCEITSCCPIIAQVIDCGFYDLALIKETTSASPFLPGDDVTYKITVCNQGTLDAANVEVTDLIPADMTLSVSDNNGWNGAAIGPVTNTIASIVAGTCEEIDIVLTIDSDFMGSSIINNAIITADDGDDVDSSPELIDMLNDLNDDNDLLETDGGDDEDPEEILVTQIYDLALIKETAAVGPFNLLDEILYTITVCNQGTLDAANVEITDYIPAGMRLAPSDGNGWAGTIFGPVTNTIPSLPAGTCETLDILLRIRSNFQGTTLINYAEISADDGDDIDSTPDQTNGNDAGGNPESPSDNVVDGDGTGAPGDSVAATDEDDHDPVLINVIQVYDLALIKETVGQGPFEAGDDVTYAITVCNQGTINAANIEVTDYIPAGMTLSSADNNGWTGPASGPVVNTIASLADGICQSLNIVLTIDAGFQGSQLVNFAEISADNGDDIDSTPDATNGNDAGGNPETPSDDALIGDGTGAPGDSIAETDEDDHDPELINIGQVFDLALIKEVPTGTYNAGDDVTYTITVTNQGSLDATSFEVTDYIPAGMTLSAADANGWAGPDAGPVTFTGGALAAGASTTIDIVLTIDPAFQGDELVNFAEISADANALNQPDVDSAPDATNGNDAGGAPDTASDDVNMGDGTGAPGDTNPATDEDDHDPESIVIGQVFDLALIKELSSAGPFGPGDDVTYTITVSNQGSLDATSFEVTDYIPAGMTLSAADANGWAGPDAGPVTFTGGALAAGASTTIDIVLTIDAAFAGEELVNFAEISADDNALGQPDVDSTPDADDTNDAGGAPDTASDNVNMGDGTGAPGDTNPATDEDDHDPEQIAVEQPLSIGSTVFADLDDSGTQDVTEAGISGVTVELVDAATGAVIATTTTDGNGDYFFDMLAPGNYIVQIPVPDAVYPTSSTPTDTADNGVDGNDNGDQPGGSGSIVQSPVITLAPGTEPTGAAEDAVTGGAQDDALDANGDMTIDFGFIPIYDLALVKQASDPNGTTYSPGDDVPYTITVCNQGTVAAANVEITDYIPTGMTLSAADANGWNGAAAGPVTNTIASIPSATCASVDIILTIDASFMGSSIVNFAEISNDDGNDIDSTPDTNVTNDAGGNPGSASDDEFMGDGTGTPGDSVAATDEDDHDPEEILLEQVYDLALTKQTASAGLLMLVMMSRIQLKYVTKVRLMLPMLK